MLELYRDKCVSFEQETPLGELSVRWIAPEAASPEHAAGPTVGWHRARSAGRSRLRQAEMIEEPREGGPRYVAESPSGLWAALEAILLVADEPVPENMIAQVVERPTGEVAAALHGLAASYVPTGRGFELREVAGGWRFYTRAECAPVVERFVRDGQEVRLTQAALETLAVVAYRQPVSRARVSAVRGVNCDGVMRTLTLRGLVEEAGHDPETGAILFRTTSYFLERLGAGRPGRTCPSSRRSCPIISTTNRIRACPAVVTSQAGAAARRRSARPRRGRAGVAPPAARARRPAGPAGRPGRASDSDDDGRRLGVSSRAEPGTRSTDVPAASGCRRCSPPRAWAAAAAARS